MFFLCKNAWLFQWPNIFHHLHHYFNPIPSYPHLPPRLVKGTKLIFLPCSPSSITSLHTLSDHKPLFWSVHQASFLGIKLSWDFQLLSTPDSTMELATAQPLTFVHSFFLIHIHTMAFCPLLGSLAPHEVSVFGVVLDTFIIFLLPQGLASNVRVLP